MGGPNFVACNKVGGKKAHPVHRSQARKDAHKVQRARCKLKEVVRKEDITRTTFGRLKENNTGHVLPKSNADLKKGQFEPMPGTRIQNGADGQPVRIVLESGKLFPPKSTFACKQHILKLIKLRKEAEEIARMRGDELPALPPGAVTEEIIQKDRTKKELRAEKKRKKSAAAAGAEAAEERAAQPLSKKQRKEQQREANQKKLEDQRKAAGERKLLAEGAWYEAEVAARDKGFAWLSLAAASDEVTGLLRRASGPEAAAPDTTGATTGTTKARLWFYDVAEQGLNLQLGAKLSVQLYSDEQGAGACNAKKSPAAGSEASTGKAAAVEPATAS